jgi:hypothetical protein
MISDEGEYLYVGEFEDGYELIRLLVQLGVARAGGEQCVSEVMKGLRLTSLCVRAVGRVYHGKGTLRSKEGDLFEGEFERGTMRRGKGKIALDEGFIYEGEIYDGEPSGYGKQYHPGTFTHTPLASSSRHFLLIRRLQLRRKAMRATGKTARTEARASSSPPMAPP